MVKQFKLRLLMAIVLVAIVSVLVRTAAWQDSTRMVLHYMLKDYGVQTRIFAWISGWSGYPIDTAIPAVSRSNIQVPCEFLGLEQGYGWYWNAQTGQELFYPGLLLKVQPNTPVRPVMDGTVIEAGESASGRSLLIQHSSGFFSYYGGLKEVFASKGGRVSTGQVLGKTGGTLYLELRDRDGPVDPQFILE